MTDRRSLVPRDWTSFIGTRSYVHPLSRCVHIYIYVYSYQVQLVAIVLYRDLPVSSGYLDSITVNVIRRLSASALVHRWKTVPRPRRRTYLIIIRITVTYCVPLHMAMYMIERSLSILKHIHRLFTDTNVQLSKFFSLLSYMYLNLESNLIEFLLSL